MTVIGLVLLLVIVFLIAATLAGIFTIAVRNDVVPQLIAAGGVAGLVVLGLVVFLFANVEQSPDVGVRENPVPQSIAAEDSAGETASTDAWTPADPLPAVAGSTSHAREANNPTAPRAEGKSTVVAATQFALTPLIGVLVAAILAGIIWLAARNDAISHLAGAGGVVALIVLGLILLKSGGDKEAPRDEVPDRSISGRKIDTMDISASREPVQSTETIAGSTLEQGKAAAGAEADKPPEDSATDVADKTTATEPTDENTSNDPDWVTNPVNEPSRVTVRSDRHTTREWAQKSLEMSAELLIRKKIAERVGGEQAAKQVELPLHEVHRFSSDQRIVEKEHQVAVSIPLSSDDYEARFERFMLLEFTPAFYAEVDRRWAEAVLNHRLRTVGLVVAAVLFVLIIVWASLKLSLSKRAAIDSKPMTN
jgi:hypothetical protein